MYPKAGFSCCANPAVLRKSDFSHRSWLFLSGNGISFSVFLDQCFTGCIWCVLAVVFLLLCGIFCCLSLTCTQLQALILKLSKNPQSHHRAGPAHHPCFEWWLLWYSLGYLSHELASMLFFLCWFWMGDCNSTSQLNRQSQRLLHWRDSGSPDREGQTVVKLNNSIRGMVDVCYQHTV